MARPLRASRTPGGGGPHLLAMVRQANTMSAHPSYPHLSGTGLGMVAAVSEQPMARLLRKRPAETNQGGGSGRPDQEKKPQQQGQGDLHEGKVSFQKRVVQDDIFGGEDVDETLPAHPFPPTPPFVRPNVTCMRPTLWDGNDFTGEDDTMDFMEGTKVPTSILGGVAPGVAKRWGRVWDFISSPRKKRAEPPVALVNDLNLQSQVRLPKSTGSKFGTKVKAKCRLSSILNMAGRNKIIKALEDDFSSNTSRKSRTAIRTTIKTIFEKSQKELVPPTPDKLKLLAGVLKAAEYKATCLYLGQYKLMVIEAGHTWSQQMARTMDLCKRSVMRAAGPKKQAKEVPTQEDGKELVPHTLHQDKLKVTLARELFEFGVVWMLREVELAAIERKHVEIDFEKRICKFTLPVSKTDQSGESVTRLLQCLCAEGCTPNCPVFVSLQLLDGMVRLNTEFANVTKDGKRANKGQIVRDWKLMFGGEVTGHSARRTGALRYIRLGWNIAQVAYLGRWSSSIICQYAAEALRELPVNDSSAFKNVEKATESQVAPRPPWILDPENVKLQLQTELEAIRLDQKATFEKLDKEVEILKARNRDGGDRLPPLVQHYQSKVVHFNADLANCSPPYVWKTLCGWHYYQSDFLFISGRGEFTLCRKCTELRA